MLTIIHLASSGIWVQEIRNLVCLWLLSPSALGSTWHAGQPLNPWPSVTVPTTASTVVIIIILRSRLGGKLLSGEKPHQDGMEEMGELEVGSSSVGVSRCSVTPCFMGRSGLPMWFDGCSLPSQLLFRSLLLPASHLWSKSSLCMCVSFSCRGYGFVKFTDELEQKRALTECQGAIGLGSKPVRLSVAIPKAWVLRWRGNRDIPCQLLIIRASACWLRGYQET